MIHHKSDPQNEQLNPNNNSDSSNKVYKESNKLKYNWFYWNIIKLKQYNSYNSDLTNVQQIQTVTFN